MRSDAAAAASGAVAAMASGETMAPLADSVRTVDLHWEGSPALLRHRASERSAAEATRTVGGNSRSGSGSPAGREFSLGTASPVLPLPERLSQQRRNRAVVERNNAAVERPHPQPRLYDRVRKRAPRLSHGGVSSQAIYGCF